MCCSICLHYVYTLFTIRTVVGGDEFSSPTVRVLTHSYIDDGLIFAPGTAVLAFCTRSLDYAHVHNLAVDYGTYQG